MTDNKKPRVNSEGERELIKVEEQFKDFDNQVKSFSMDSNQLPLKETENQTKLSSKDIEKSKGIYLKPSKSVGPGPKENFNEKFRDDYNFRKEIVNFIAENDIIGETIELWTKPFPGMNCEFWQVPVNIPVWGPRHLAERIADCNYRVLEMKEEMATQNTAGGQFYGKVVAKSMVSRLKAYPVSERKSIFMGEGGFRGIA